MKRAKVVRKLNIDHTVNVSMSFIFVIKFPSLK
jgi:hypothetical protein